MSADDPSDPSDPTDAEDADEIEPADLRAELDRQRGGAEPPRDGEDLVDLLSAVFDTDKRTRVYVGLRRRPDATVEELATETGLYPATVDRVLSDLADEDVVERRTIGGDATYTAVAPHEVVDVAIGRVQEAIDDRFAPRRRGRSRPDADRTEPVTIPVEKEPDGRNADDRDDTDR